MYCKHCGAQVPEDVKFCTNCGAKLDVPAQPAAPVSEPKGKVLIVPAILAGLALLFSLFGMVSAQISMPSFHSSPIFLLNRIQSLLTYLFAIAAELFVFLYCLVQAKKRKASLFGAASLMLVLRAAAGIVFTLAISAASRMRAVNVRTLMLLSYIGIALQLAVIVLFLLAMIFAFKNKIAKGIVIVGAIVLILAAIVPNLGYLSSTAVTLNSLFALLLPLSILLVGILAKNK